MYCYVKAENRLANSGVTFSGVRILRPQDQGGIAFGREEACSLQGPGDAGGGSNSQPQP